MSLSDEFKIAIKNWLKKQYGVDDEISEIIDWREDPGSGGGCDTCGYGASPTEVEIDYVTSDLENKCYYYTGTFTELLAELLAE